MREEKKASQLMGFEAPTLSFCLYTLSKADSRLRNPFNEPSLSDWAHLIPLALSSCVVVIIGLVGFCSLIEKDTK